MTNAGTRMAIAGLALFLAVPGTAHAAKGVKKVAPANNVPRMVHGIVTGVAHQNGSNSFHVRTAHHHRKIGGVNQVGAGGGPATGVNQRYHSHTFHVTAATRFGHQNGNPASMASLRRGERVKVQATGNQAQTVMIMSHHHRARGYFTRYRTNVYRPHLYHRIHRRRR